METIELVVSSDLNGERLDKAIPKLFPELSRNAVQQLISEDAVLVNGDLSNKKTTVKTDDVISIDVPEHLLK